MAFSKESRRTKIKSKIRKVVSGSAERPRLSVFRSNKQISAQLIDDVASKTLLHASSSEKGVTTKKSTKIDQAKLVGKLIGERALGAGIKTVVFDRNGYLYHGRIKSLADGAREAGLTF